MNTKRLIEKIERATKDYPSITFDTPGKIHTCVNSYSYLLLKKKKVAVEEFDGVFVDGISMCWFLRLYWGKKIKRLSFDMTTIAKDFFERCEMTGESIYLIGSKQEDIEKAVVEMKNHYPKLNIIEYRNGYLKDNLEKDSVIQHIIDLKPNFVIAGMGTPLQENFLLDLRKSGFTGISFTCGGFFHQTAQGIIYYPDWINKYNLRGPYRQLKEKGIFGRNFDTIIAFPIVFLCDTIKSKFNKI